MDAVQMSKQFVRKPTVRSMCPGGEGYISPSSVFVLGTGTWLKANAPVYPGPGGEGYNVGDPIQGGIKVVRRGNRRGRELDLTEWDGVLPRQCSIGSVPVVAVTKIVH